MIQGAYSSDSSTKSIVIFFKNDYWYRYDFEKGEVIKKFEKSEKFSELPIQIDAVLEGRESRKDKLYFFSGDKYYRYDVFKAKLDSGYPKAIKDYWKDLGFDKVSCALNTSGSKAYLFHYGMYSRYDFSTLKVDPGYPKPIHAYWNGIPQDPDAAFQGMKSRSNKYYFFKGQEYYRYDLNQKKVDEGYPRPIFGNFKGLLERKELERILTFPMVSKITGTSIDRDFGPQEKNSTNESEELFLVNGKIFLPYVNGKVIYSCMDHSGNIYGLVNNNSRVNCQVLKLLPTGERDLNFGDNGLTTIELKEEYFSRSLEPVAIDVSIDGSIVVGMNLSHNIHKDSSKGILSYALQRISSSGNLVGSFIWPVNKEKQEVLNDLKIDAKNNIYCSGTSSDALFKAITDFIHFYDSNFLGKEIPTRPFGFNYDSVPFYSDNSTLNNKTIILGKDLFNRIYVGQDGQNKNLYIWRLTENGTLDNNFTPLNFDGSNRLSHNLSPTHFSFGQFRAALNFNSTNKDSGAIIFDLNGKILDNNSNGFTIPLKSRELKKLNDTSSDFGVFNTNKFEKQLSINYIDYGSPKLMSMSRYIDTSVIFTSVTKKLGGANRNSVKTDFLPSIHGFKFSNGKFNNVFMDLFGASHGSEAFKAGFSGTWSLCGGMAQAAADFYYFKRTIPDHVNAPATSSSLMTYIIKRQKDSFEAGKKKKGFWDRVNQYMNVSIEGYYDLVNTFIIGEKSDNSFWHILKNDFPTGANFMAFWKFEKSRFRPSNWRSLVSYTEWHKIKATIDAFGFAQIGLNYARKSEGKEIADNHQVLATGYRLDSQGHLEELDIYEVNCPCQDNQIIRVSRRFEETIIDLSTKKSKKIYGYEFNQFSRDSIKKIHGIFLIPLEPMEPPLDLV